ncbi:MAG: hypothetical protein D6820_03375, partial [Lentisphaerae bacterium]
PIVLSEYSFPAMESNNPNTKGAGQRVGTQRQRANCFKFMNRAFLSQPFMVGMIWFAWVDRPNILKSKGFSEDCNYGLVKRNDEPWEALTRTATEVHAQVYGIHAAGKPVDIFTPTVCKWKPAVPPLHPATTRSFSNGRFTLEITEKLVNFSCDGRSLGVFHPLIQQKVPESRWVLPATIEITGSGQNEEFTVIEVLMHLPPKSRTLVDAGNGQAPPGGARRFAACRSAWRFWLPRSPEPWVATQHLWIESDDPEPWTLARLFMGCRPAIDGVEHDRASRIRGYFLYTTAWEDSTVHRSLLTYAPHDTMELMGYNFRNNRYYAEIRLPINRVMHRGERVMTGGVTTIHAAVDWKNISQREAAGKMIKQFEPYFEAVYSQTTALDTNVTNE